jgi:IS5 family transposase
VNPHLKVTGMAVKQATIVDTSIIAAPCSTKDKAVHRDPEKHQTEIAN